VAEGLAESLPLSPAIGTGLLLDLHNSYLVIVGIGSGLISDIITIIIRKMVIRFTQLVCER